MALNTPDKSPFRGEFMRLKYRMLMLTMFLSLSNFSHAAEKKKLTVSVHINTASQSRSAEGFVDSSDVWLRDSAKDMKKAMDGKEFRPNKACPGTRSRYSVTPDPTGADITLTVAARGTSAAELGQRTSIQLYNGVLLADTVPTVGVTRWVSVVLSVGTYRREFLAWHTNRSKLSAGAWSADAKLLAGMAACWVMVNEDKILERQSARQKGQK